MSIKLTSFSHGAGCGCKLSPEVLQYILSGGGTNGFEKLMVGNDTNDDAAVYDLDGEKAIISTTDFFTPIVDDPADFGAIAATNAISDVYAMGGSPLMAIAILGWPIDKIDASIAGEVMAGARKKCQEAGIPLAGGHSIDTIEPIFGLAVTGQVSKEHLKRNSSAKEGDLIYLTKPIGVGLVTTAQKKGIADREDLDIARKSMLTLNNIGAELSYISGVHAMTDVTGFGLAGHLIEMAESGDLTAFIDPNSIPVFQFVGKYLDAGTIPGGTTRNWNSYGHKIHGNGIDHRLLADPQTSGGLLISVSPDQSSKVEKLFNLHGVESTYFGEFRRKSDHSIVVQ